MYRIRRWNLFLSPFLTLASIIGLVPAGGYASNEASVPLFFKYN